MSSWASEWIMGKVTSIYRVTELNEMHVKWSEVKACQINWGMLVINQCNGNPGAVRHATECQWTQNESARRERWAVPNRIAGPMGCRRRPTITVQQPQQQQQQQQRRSRLPAMSCPCHRKKRTKRSSIGSFHHRWPGTIIQTLYLPYSLVHWFHLFFYLFVFLIIHMNLEMLAFGL